MAAALSHAHTRTRRGLPARAHMYMVRGDIPAHEPAERTAAAAEIALTAGVLDTATIDLLHRSWIRIHDLTPNEATRVRACRRAAWWRTAAARAAVHVSHTPVVPGWQPSGAVAPGDEPVVSTRPAAPPFQESPPSTSTAVPLPPQLQQRPGVERFGFDVIAWVRSEVAQSFAELEADGADVG